MPKISTRIPFLPGNIYHMYNRGNNGDVLFYNISNYYYFLFLFEKFLSENVDTYAYCLMPNHFHFLLKIQEDCSEENFNRQIRRFFITYALSINRQENRSGALFTRPVKRIQVLSDAYFKRLVFYIHYNPVKHKVSSDFKKFVFSSFRNFSCNTKSNIQLNNTLEWFNNDIQEFIEYHNYLHDEKEIHKLILEE